MPGPHLTPIADNHGYLHARIYIVARAFGRLATKDPEASGMDYVLQSSGVPLAFCAGTQLLIGLARSRQNLWVGRFIPVPLSGCSAVSDGAMVNAGRCIRPPRWPSWNNSAVLAADTADKCAGVLAVHRTRYWAQGGNNGLYGRKLAYDKAEAPRFEEHA